MDAPLATGPAMIENRTFDELEIGEHASTTRTLTKEDIDLFAIMSGDVNPAHLDPAYAETDMFHKIIGHGMWGGALISMLLGTQLPGPGTIYLSQELRFRRPVGIGDSITTTITVLEKRAESGNVILDCTCTNQDGKSVSQAHRGIAETHVRLVTDALDCPILLPCDVHEPGQLDAVFAEIDQKRQGLDFVLHSIAFAPRDDLQGRIVDSSAAGFATAMDISCHSLLRMALLAEPLMPNGGCLLTVSFYGAERVVANYNMMGPVKAALESMVRYTAVELGPKGIRAHAISPGPILTRAASGIAHFDELLEHSANSAPEHLGVNIGDVGGLAAFLVSDAARHITGTIIPVDGGRHLLA